MIRRLLILGAAALALGAGLRFYTLPPAAIATADKQVPTPTTQGGWDLVWTRSAPQLAALSLAPDGSRAAWVDGKGSIRGITRDGKTVVQTAPRDGISRVAVSLGGVIIGYAPLDPTRANVVLAGLPGAGNRVRAVPVEGAIWNVAPAPDSENALIGTGERFVYLLPLGSAAAPPIRWRAPGIPDSLSLCGDAAPIALLSTWQNAGVSAWSLDGTPRWQRDASEPDRLYDVFLSADGKTAIGLSARGPRETNARLHVWDAENGRIRWIADLDGSRPEVMVSQSGRYVAVSYITNAAYLTGTVTERKLSLFDPLGRRLFKDKGGPFFAPRLVALSADGARLTVRDGRGIVYTVQRDGKFVSEMRLPIHPKTGQRPTVRDTVASADGKYLLIHQGDGQISLYRAAAL